MDKTWSERFIAVSLLVGTRTLDSLWSCRTIRIETIGFCIPVQLIPNFTAATYFRCQMKFEAALIHNLLLQSLLVLHNLWTDNDCLRGTR